MTNNMTWVPHTFVATATLGGPCANCADPWEPFVVDAGGLTATCFACGWDTRTLPTAAPTPAAVAVTVTVTEPFCGCGNWTVTADRCHDC